MRADSKIVRHTLLTFCGVDGTPLEFEIKKSFSTLIPWSITKCSTKYLHVFHSASNAHLWLVCVIYRRQVKEIMLVDDDEGNSLLALAVVSGRIYSADAP